MQTIYLIEVRHVGGNYFAERDTNECDRATVVNDVLTGQVEDVARVIEVIPSEGTSRDVTEDIAREIASRVLDSIPQGGSCSDDLLALVERHAPALAAEIARAQRA